MEDLDSIVGRCTHGAWQAVKALRDHPRLLEVISELANKPGTIRKHDVESAVAEVTEMQNSRRAREVCGR